MRIPIMVAIVALMVLTSGCISHPVDPSVPPGQVQKATGYNPASGHVKVK
jgi:hypothetical protein